MSEVRKLTFEELPEVNSERWLSLEDLPGEEWRDVVGCYPSLKECSKNTGVPSSRICECIKSGKISKGGYEFKYM